MIKRDIQVLFTYTELGRENNRQKRMRYIPYHDGCIHVSIPDLAVEEFPMVLKLTDFQRRNRPEIIYRFYDNRLWVHSQMAAVNLDYRNLEQKSFIGSEYRVGKESNLGASTISTHPSWEGAIMVWFKDKVVFENAYWIPVPTPFCWIGTMHFGIIRLGIQDEFYPECHMFGLDQVERAIGYSQYEISFEVSRLENYPIQVDFEFELLRPDLYHFDAGEQRMAYEQDKHLEINDLIQKVKSSHDLPDVADQIMFLISNKREEFEEYILYRFMQAIVCLTNEKYSFESQQNSAIAWLSGTHLHAKWREENQWLHSHNLLTSKDYLKRLREYHLTVVREGDFEKHYKALLNE